MDSFKQELKDIYGDRINKSSKTLINEEYSDKKYNDYYGIFNKKWMGKLCDDENEIQNNFIKIWNYNILLTMCGITSRRKIAAISSCSRS